MKPRYIIFTKAIGLFFFSIFFNSAISQTYYGSQAQNILKNSDLIRLNERSNIPEFFRLSKSIPFSETGFHDWLKKHFNIQSGLTLKLKNTEVDQIGFTHYRYQQLYNSIPILGKYYYAHIKESRLVSANGVLFNQITTANGSNINEASALTEALKFVNATTYKWENEEEEQHLKWETQNPTATYYPKGELVYIEANSPSTKITLAYKFNIYASDPLYRANVFVEATTGKIIAEHDLIHTGDVVGTAVTKYSGNQQMTADYTGSTYRLRESGRGNGIETYDLNEGTNYGNATDFTDSDNFWNNVNGNQDEIATDAHWGAEMTYDYLLNEHNRNSIDGNGFTLKSYIHYSNNYNNAFWDGQRMTYGDGSGNYDPFTALDIAGHEVSHGLTSFTADLVYSYESGALNESFSDIIGTSVEFYAKPSQANWLCGEDIGVVLRDLSNPNAYGDPDTYQGTNWYTGTGDNGGVHTNSGVQNFWYYLLATGGSGTNDNGDSYNINGIGLSSAGQIAFRNLTVYLGTNSQYSDARFYAIQSAIDLFGPCSPEVVATTDAWYAVGVGAAFDSTVTSDFSANPFSSCSAPFTVSFTNSSQNGGSFTWDFGDGSTSTSTNPSHTYNTYGNYTVKLIADGNPCGIDSLIRTAYIVIDSTLPCQVNLPNSGSGSIQTACAGTVYDNGGATGNYADNTTSQITISPIGASSVTLDFVSFDIETSSNGNPPCDYDYVEIFDGPNTSSPSLGAFCNATGSPGTLTSTGGSITIFHYADPNVNEAGFEAQWTCTLPNVPPSPDFNANVTNTCTGEVQFADLTTNGPTAWSWNFGDGGTSTQQNPQYTYSNSGTYTVTLVATNNFGSNSEIKTSYISVTKPIAPNTTSASRCGPGSVTLSASGTGDIKWYSDSTGSNLISTGNTYSTNSLNSTTDFYVQDIIIPPSQYVGPADNNIGNGGNHTNTSYYLTFDCISDFTLLSVKVYASGNGYRTIELRNSSGTVLQDTNVNIPDGESRVILDFSVTPGTDYQLATSGQTNLYRSSSGTNFPYTIAGLVSITGNNITPTNLDYYYYYYDWEVQEPVCSSEPAMVTATIFDLPIITTSSVDISCNGSCDGSASATSSSGAAPYTYLWSNGSISSSINTLCAGTYFVTVSDVNGCSSMDSTTVNDSPPISLSTSSVDATCGNADGEATATASAGSPPYTYLWDDPNTQTTSTATGLNAGVYSVTITDANSCTVTATVNVNNSIPSISITSSTDATCNGSSDGELNASATGGTPPYTYLWNDTNAQTTNNATGLSAGTYSVTVTDNVGCFSTSSGVVNQPLALSLSVTPTDASCGNACNGSGACFVTNGVGPFTYNWDDPMSQTNSVATGLCAGNYNVTVTDANNCQSTTAITINGGTGVALSITALTNTSCGVCNGEATVSASSGTLPYTYIWDDPNAQTVATATGLCAGVYNVTATDNLGCSETVTLEIFDFGGIFSNISSTTSVSCNGGSDGQATVTISGGVAPFAYLWNDLMNQTDSTAINLSAGIYVVQITDSNGCITTSTSTISEPSAIALTTNNVPASCGNNDGSATVSASGGTVVGSYQYLWDDPGTQTNATATGLTSGTYQVTVTDDNGCTASASTILSNTGGPAVQLTTNGVSCNGISDGSITASATNGTPPLTYIWNDPGVQTTATATGLSAGIYTVAVTDASGCVTNESDTVSEPSPLLLSINSNNASCGSNDGDATVMTSGGIGPFLYLWDDPGAQTTSTANGLNTGTYIVLVTDANNCQASQSVTISSTGNLSLQLAITSASCNGSSDGSINAIATTGSAPFTYLWDDPNAQTNATATGLAAGTYTVVVNGAGGCSSSQTGLIYEPSEILLSITSNPASCAGGGGDATGNATGGTPPYFYQWDDPNTQTTNTAIGLVAGSYTLTLTDSNNCQLNQSVLITNIGGPSILITAGNISCNGRTDGIASPSISGSPGPFTYIWDDPNTQTTAIATGLGVGTYTLSVTDANGCMNAETIVITQPPALYISTNTINSLGNNCTGEASVSGNGGTSPYSWLWDNGSTSTNLTGLCPGTYIVNITDANGCTESAAVSIGTILGGTTPNEQLSFNIFPNPFSHSSQISFELIKETNVLLEVFNLLGESIEVIENRKLTKGMYKYTFKNSNGSSGIYLVKFISNGKTQTKRLIQLK